MLGSIRHGCSVALVVAVALGATGCTPLGAGSSTIASSGPSALPAPAVPLASMHLLADPKHATGAIATSVGAAPITPIARNPRSKLPVDVVSHDPSGDTTVRVTDTSRIIALDIAGSLASTVQGLGLGGSLVARDESTQFPGAERLPVVTGDSHTVNSEAIIARRPTVVITDGTIGPIDVLQQLREVGIAVVFVKNPPTIDGAAALATSVGAALGVPGVGAALAARTTAQIDRVLVDIRRIAPRDPAKKVRVLFLYLRGSAGIYYLFGKGTGADSLITALGAVDVAAEIGWVGTRPMTAEALVAAAPDAILVMKDGLASVGGVDGLLAAKREVALTPAGQRRRFISMPDGELLSFGPRTPLVLTALARALYGRP